MEVVSNTTTTPLIRPITCANCGQATTSCNLNFDYRSMTATAVCEHCRAPLPKTGGTNG